MHLKKKIVSQISRELTIFKCILQIQKTVSHKFSTVIYLQNIKKV